MTVLSLHDLAFAQSTPGASASKVVGLIGKLKPGIEKALGKPTSSGTETEGSLLDWCVYTLPGTEGIRIHYAARGGGGEKTLAVDYEISLAKGATWQSAMTTLGLDAGKMKTKPMDNIAGMSMIIGHPFKDWNVYFVAANARYPGAKNLINTNHGLPMISMEQRSLNE
jgi:hypothetical protein